MKKKNGEEPHKLHDQSIAKFLFLPENYVRLARHDSGLQRNNSPIIRAKAGSSGFRSTNANLYAVNTMRILPKERGPVTRRMWRNL